MKRVRKLLGNSKGFTFIEVMAVMIILSVVTAPILYLFFQPQRETPISQKKIDAQHTANKVINMVLEEMRRVESEEITMPGGNILPGIEVYNQTIVVARTSTSQIAYAFNNTGTVGKVYKYVDGQNGQSILRTVDVSTGRVTITVNGTGTLVADNVTDFKVDSITDSGGSKIVAYQVTAEIKPIDVGKIIIDPEKVTRKFVPRYNMDIR